MLIGFPSRTSAAAIVNGIVPLLAPMPSARTNASYRVECVDRPDSAAEHRRHLTGIGTVEQDGTRRHWDDIAVVRDAMSEGDSFYTKSLMNEKMAAVEAYDCPCGVETIRSNPDHVAHNNLDNMVACPL
jgi:hypothetical protein